LLIVVLLEGIIGPRLWLLELLGMAQPPDGLRVPALLALALLLVRYFAGLRFGAIGFRRWREWSLAEKSYFIQVACAASIVFAVLYPGALQASVAMLATNFLWGFHQEVVYRGMLQTELARRIGGVAGVLVANLFFTFGPLHLYHFSGATPWPMFAAIFAIGLLFGAIFQRSGNLWIVAVFHGLGTAFILSSR
jgi:CAAX protease family protein